jgi:ferredoxin-thioredoxin reductase catalytic subunit
MGISMTGSEPGANGSGCRLYTKSREQKLLAVCPMMQEPEPEPEVLDQRGKCYDAEDEAEEERGVEGKSDLEVQPQLKL